MNMIKWKVFTLKETTSETDAKDRDRFRRVKGISTVKEAKNS